MNKTFLLIVVIALLVVPRLDQIKDEPATQTQYDFSVAVSKLPDAKTRSFVGGLCVAIADRIETDTNKLKYVANINDLKNDAVSVGLNGKKLSDIAPDFGPAVGVIFAKELPNGSAELNQETRKKAAELFHDLGVACE